MAKKVTGASLNVSDDAVKKNDITVHFGDSKDTCITVYNTISLKNMMQFVNDVVGSCFNEEGTYIPEAKDFCIRVCMFENYTNLKLPKSTDKQYDIVYGHDMNGKSLYNEISSHIDVDQYDSIIEAIDEKIAHKLNIIESSAVSKVNELLEKINTITEQMESVLGNITSEDISGFLKNISGIGEMTEESLAKAVLGVQKEAKQKNRNVVSVRK